MSHLGLSVKEINGQIQDIHLDSSGNLAIVRDAEAVGQHAKQRLKTYEGEWFLDTKAGTPWLSEILGKNYDAALAETVVKAELLETHGVTEITSFSVKFDRSTRNLTNHSISVLTEYDEEVDL